MTDNTVPQNEPLWLPDDVWEVIASFLDNHDLAIFRQLCTVTNEVGSHTVVLQPLYNRLYALDNTLPLLLPEEEGALLTFKQAFEKIQTRQQFEIAYLMQYHSTLIAKAEYLQGLKESTAASLKSLEVRSSILDKINGNIIEAKIDVNSNFLYLNKTHITRLPVTLFQAPDYIHFWQNLTRLNCIDNQLTALNVQGLTALQILHCSKNQLTVLNVQGLAVLNTLWCYSNELTNLNVQRLGALKELLCYDNQLTLLNTQGLTALQSLMCSNNLLTALNLQGFTALEWLDCDNNPLEALILTGVDAHVKNKYVELEKRLLLNQMVQADSVNLSQLSPTYLPFSGANNNLSENSKLKRKRDEEEPDGEPDLKKIKKTNLN